jgi:hypothetical protein
MSQAVGMPAEAEAPAPRSHIIFPRRIENRRAKSSGAIDKDLLGTVSPVSFTF